jgi:hypothetical protein
MMISILQRLWCSVRGHDWIFRVDRKRRVVFLECLRCQKITTGWALNASTPEPIDN